MSDKLNGIIISEVLADNPTGSLDVNNSGQGNKLDEFVEFQNTTNADIDLGGYQVWSFENGLLHTFTAGTTLAAGDTVAVLGEFDPAIPANSGIDNFYQANGNANNNIASSNGGFLEDGEGQKNDTIYLVDANPGSPTFGDYIQLSYGQNLNIPGALPSGFPAGGTMQGDGETISSDAPNTTSFLRDGAGNFVEGPPTPGNPGVPCFTPGTLITTESGDVAVEDLKPGMRVLSRDHGYVTLRATRSADIRPAVLRWNPDLCPVVVPSGVLGNHRAMTFSPAHRILVQGIDVELVCGGAEAFVPAHHFVGLAGSTRLPANRPVTYIHLLFDHHEVICSDGVWTESLFMGDVAQAAIRAVEDWTVQDGFDLGQVIHRRTARIVLKRHEAAVLLDRLGLKQDTEMDFPRQAAS